MKELCLRTTGLGLKDDVIFFNQVYFPGIKNSDSVELKSSYSHERLVFSMSEVKQIHKWFGEFIKIYSKRGDKK